MTSSSLLPASVRRTGAALFLVMSVCATAPVATSAQVPPDSIRPDSIAPDSLAQVADTAAADTVFYNLPSLEVDLGEGWAASVWSWDHDEILASGANTLADLLATVPGVLGMLAGDLGEPSAVTAFGLGGEGIRILRDGFEVIPLGGGMTDLSHVGLGGITGVRLVRGLSGLRIELTSLEFGEPRPYSLIEAGTGDLNTNLFRGVFANPRALGGSVALALERLDSRGARGDEPGKRTGSWFRYQLHRGDDSGLALDFRRSAVDGQSGLYASSVLRTDLTLRGRARLATGVTTEAYWGRSSHDLDESREEYALEGGTRSQLGLRATVDRSGLHATGAWRRFGGDELPGSRLELEVGGVREEVGGLSVGLDRSGWDGTSTTMKRARAWTRPVAGLSLFASWSDGALGARSGPLLDVELPPDTTTAPQEPDTAGVDPGPLFRVSQRSATRVGAMFQWRGLALSGARLSVEADSLLPLGIEPDRGEPPMPGGSRSGWEAWGRVPLPLMDGLALQGSLQRWDEAWSYLPDEIYQVEIDYRNTFLESGNFEMWFKLGVRGRSAMQVRQFLGEVEDEEGVLVPEYGAVPFAQNWYARFQMRIVSVRIFIVWDNFTIRRNLQDFPDRLLPQTRAMYGLRWTMWN